MTSFRIPLKNKIKAIQQEPQSIEDIEIPDKSAGLKISLRNKPVVDCTDENDQLRKKNAILEESLQKAREEAFLSGIDEGREQLRNEMETRLYRELNSLQKMVNKITVNLEKEIKNLEQPVLKLSKEIAKRIISSELQFEEKYNEVLVSQISNILHEMMDQEIITIHVSPQQIEWIIKTDLEKKVNLPDNIKIKFFEDRSLDPGECILESSNLLIEGKFSTQLNQIENQLIHS